ncbi:hypothetical protein K491DRAFT_714501 [Lophiostoma macrostomum CBS 122681]|uniref:Uncharacterized protein n=1 Tax=Lophiostoma macrostomum CBS 122681 TaxID=1314788 RepID=A0A6A6TBX5_9PLEO|nr:hypothetical protein K491DRAFT_714501 [Lophiostoma macrostomum CBS 122681]
MSRCAPVKHNLIGDNVAYARGLGVARESVDEIVHVPLPSGGQKGENAKFAVTLTWRRSKETKTNMCAFYVVSSELLETDVILGSEDCLDRQIPPDVYEVHSPQVNYQREGFVEMEELVPAVSQHAPSVLRHIYHQNTMTPDTQRTHARVQALEDMRRTHATDSTTPTPQSKHKDSKSSTHTSTPLQGQASLSDQIQVSGFWGKTPIKMSFDPDAPGEAFYQAFYQWAVRRKRDGDLERHRMTLWLKASKNMPHEEAYDLRLEEDELENFWESAVDWIQENKNPKAPHLYATVEFEAV